MNCFTCGCVSRKLVSDSVGEMNLTAILFAGWVFGAIAFAIVPQRSVRWKLIAIATLFLVFCIEGALLYWQYLRPPEQQTLPHTEEGPRSAPPLPQPSTRNPASR
jgi:hypothetical protein